MKKFLSTLLVLTMVVSLSACFGDTGGDSNTTTSSKNDTATTQKQASETKSEAPEDSGYPYDGTWGAKIVNDPIEIKVFARQDSDGTADPDKAFFARYADMTGVTIVDTANANVDQLTDLNVHATDRFPSDIISVAHLRDEMERFAAEGAFLDLHDYLHLMPNLQAFIKTDLGKQAYEASLTSDGHFYLIPAVERFKPTHIPMIRKDWLDTLGMEVPQTTDELYTALKAFKDNDLGDGLTVPFLSKHWVLKQNAASLFGARIYTRATGRIVNNEDGTFAHGWGTEGFRTAVTEFSKWYDEGILAQDLFTADKPLEKHFPTNQGGFTYWSISKLGFNDQPDMPEGFELVPMLPTAHNDAGDRLDVRATHYMRKGRAGISAASKNPEVAAMVLDSFLSLEGAMAQAYGFEGEQYTLDMETEDGLKIYRYTEAWDNMIKTEYNNDGKQARLAYGFINIGVSHDAFYDQTRVIEFDEEFGESVIDQVEKMYLEAFADGTVTFIPGANVSFTPEQLVEINTIKGALETYQNEFFEKSIVQDYKTLDDAWWQTYLDTCESLGMSRMVELYNSGL